MMTSLGFLLLASIVGVCISLASPATISKIARRPVSSKQGVLLFGGIFALTFILIGIFVPPVANKRGIVVVPQSNATSTNSPTSVAMVGTTTEVTTAIGPVADVVVPAATIEQKTTTSTETGYLVTRVVDGDTFDVGINGKTERIRMIGIDTPETVYPRKPVQCFGKEASAKMTALISGRRVTLEADLTQGERDKYGRLLRYAFLPDGLHVGLYLIQEGYAHEYTYNLPYKYQQVFKDAERAAREAKKGLWADNACLTIQSTTPTATAPVTSPLPIPSSGPEVKKSTTGICHQRGTTYYDRTKNYTPYDSLQVCLASGGRLPK